MIPKTIKKRNGMCLGECQICSSTAQQEVHYYLDVGLFHENKSALSFSSLTERTPLFYIHTYRNLIIQQLLINIL
jgi:hypothetical protein